MNLRCSDQPWHQRQGETYESHPTLRGWMTPEAPKQPQQEDFKHHSDSLQTQTGSSLMAARLPPGQRTHLSYHFAAVRLSVLLLTRSQLPMLSFPLLVPPCTEQGAGWGPALTKGFVCKGWLTLNTTHTFSSVCDMQIWKYTSSPSEIFRFDFPTRHPFQLKS